MGGLGRRWRKGSWKLRDVEMFGLDQGTISDTGICHLMPGEEPVTVASALLERSAKLGVERRDRQRGSEGASSFRWSPW